MLQIQIHAGDDGHPDPDKLERYSVGGIRLEWGVAVMIFLKME